MSMNDPAFVYHSCQHDIDIHVRPFFVPERSLPSRSIFFYAYSIKVTNHRSSSITILKRKWTIRNGLGEQEQILGDGVVGKTPVIAPRDHFQYASFCPLETETGNMRGQYLVQLGEGKKLWVDIPLFFFRMPYQAGGEEYAPQQVS